MFESKARIQMRASQFRYYLASADMTDILTVINPQTTIRGQRIARQINDRSCSVREEEIEREQTEIVIHSEQPISWNIKLLNLQALKRRTKTN